MYKWKLEVARDLDFLKNLMIRSDPVFAKRWVRKTWKNRARLLPGAIGLDGLGTCGPISQPLRDRNICRKQLGTILNACRYVFDQKESKNNEKWWKITKIDRNRDYEKNLVPHGQSRWKFTHGLVSIYEWVCVYQKFGSRHGSLRKSKITIARPGCGGCLALWSLFWFFD